MAAGRVHRPTSTSAPATSSMVDAQPPGQVSAAIVPPLPSTPPKAPNRLDTPWRVKRNDTTTLVTPRTAAGSFAGVGETAGAVVRSVVGSVAVMAAVLSIALPYHHGVGRGPNGSMESASFFSAHQPRPACQLKCQALFWVVEVDVEQGRNLA